MNILFYFPTSLRANSLSSLMVAFRQMGHKVYFISHDPKGELQADVEPFGVVTENFTTSLTGIGFYWWQYKKLRKFIKTEKIDIVFSHTQQANIISCFLKNKTNRVILCRHHTDYVFYGNNKNAKRFDAIINKRGKEFIVPAQKTFRQMVENENVDASKIKIIPYGYDFSQYANPVPLEVEKIKQQYHARPFLLSMGRMMPEKRHIEMIEIMSRIKSVNSNAKLVILGDGELRPVLEEKIKILGLENHVFLPGRKTNIMDYLEACDILIHNSESETSCSVVKEAALVEKPVVVCKDVGDFDEYLVNNKNALVISRYDYADELTGLIENYQAKSASYQALGKQLKKDVLSLFSVNSVAKQYEQYFNK